MRKLSLKSRLSICIAFFLICGLLLARPFAREAIKGTETLVEVVDIMRNDCGKPELIYKKGNTIKSREVDFSTWYEVTKLKRTKVWITIPNEKYDIIGVFVLATFIASVSVSLIYLILEKGWLSLIWFAVVVVSAFVLFI